jgi:2,4-dienoyl-CoA reductase-like NADH-dependent reductase (Old Yellow Enzyme family)
MKNIVFEPITIAGIQFKNHIIRAATHEGMANEIGQPTEQLKDLYVRLAKGGVGGIITGYAGIMQQGKSDNFNMLMMDKDELVDSYKNLVDEVHKYGVPIILQLAHTGRQTSSLATGMTPLAPSPIKDKIYNKELPLEATDADIEEIIGHFVSAARRSESAGFDGIQIHAAHGYLLSSFLSSYSNRRTDKWGGILENRYRIVGEIIKRIKENIPGYPVLVKLNAYDNRKNGMRIEESVEIAKMLQKSGCGAIEVSCGVMEDGLNMSRSPKVPIDALLKFNPKFRNKHTWIKNMARPFIKFVFPALKPIKNYNVAAAERIKNAVSIPVTAIGGIRSKDDIIDIIESGKVDMVSMCRPFIIEPNIVKKFEDGKQDDSRCIDCNYCLMAAQVKPLKCYYGKIR